MSTPPGEEHVPQPAGASSEEAPAEQDNGKEAKREGPVLLKNLQSLERLRGRVKRAARELERLRQENEALAARIRELETRPPVDLDGTALLFDEDPDQLREKMERFISAIDQYLAKENG